MMRKKKSEKPESAPLTPEAEEPVEFPLGFDHVKAVAWIRENVVTVPQRHIAELCFQMTMLAQTPEPEPEPAPKLRVADPPRRRDLAEADHGETAEADPEADPEA